MPSRISVQATAYLQNSLAAAELENLFADFAEWKSLGAAGENYSYIFGKDAAYKPPICQHYELRHAHMAPLSNPFAMALWNWAWNQTPPRKRTSDKALIYTQSENKYSKKIGFLLISIIDDPEAHRTAKMSTPQDKALMQHFAKIAKEFIFSGKIIA